MPELPTPIFWTMQCSLNKAGEVRARLFWIPPVLMSVGEKGRDTRTFRALMPMLTAPSLVISFPATWLSLRKFLGKPIPGSR